MANQNDKKKKNEEVQADNGLKPDSKTLHVEEDDTTKEEADKKKEENM